MFQSLYEGEKRQHSDLKMLGKLLKSRKEENRLHYGALWANRTIIWGDDPANTRRCPNVGPMLGQRRRRWHSAGPTLG